MDTQKNREAFDERVFFEGELAEPQDRLCQSEQQEAGDVEQCRAGKDEQRAGVWGEG